MQIMIAAALALALAAPLRPAEPRILESAARLAAETQLDRTEPERRRPARPIGRWIVASAIIGAIVAAVVLTGADAPRTLQQGDPPPPPRL